MVLPIGLPIVLPFGLPIELPIKLPIAYWIHSEAMPSLHAPCQGCEHCLSAPGGPPAARPAKGCEAADHAHDKNRGMTIGQYNRQYNRQFNRQFNRQLKNYF